MHRIRQDEIWHFYLEGTLHLVMISPEECFTDVLPGQNVQGDEYVQYVVSVDDWFGAGPVAGSGFSFIGYSMTLGFDFEDFELGVCAELLA